MGVAMLAGYGVGLWKNLDIAVAQWLRKGNRFRPQRKLGDFYQTRLERYKRLLDVLDQWAEAHAETSP